MSNNAVIVIAIVLQGVSVIAAIAGVVFLADQGKDGWGWLIFLACVLGGYSFRRTSDDKEKPKQE